MGIDTFGRRFGLVVSIYTCCFKEIIIWSWALFFFWQIMGEGVFAMVWYGITYLVYRDSKQPKDDCRLDYRNAGIPDGEVCFPREMCSPRLPRRVLKRGFS